MSIISLLLPDLRGGGAERVAVNIANALVNRHHDVDFVLMDATGELLSELSPQVRVVNLSSPRVRQCLLPLVRYLREAQPSAVLASMWPLTVIAVLARLVARVKCRVVVAEHTTWSRSELLRRPTVGWQVRTSMHFVFPHADGIVCVSDGAAEDLAEFARLDRKSITRIYNPIVGRDNSCSGGVLSPEEWWVGSHRRILAVGTLKTVKDYATLLNAISRLRSRVDARLLILGEGECRAALNEQIRELGLQGSVFMPGFVRDPSPYYHHADLHVLSSVAEGFGNVVAEALAAGTAVVSTDCPSGPREILADGKFGRLVPVGDVAALAQAMQAALEAPADVAALKARAQDFSIEKAVDEYERLLFPSVEGRTG